MKSKLWSYINTRFENDGVLIGKDEVFQAFQLQFDTGTPLEIIDEVLESFVSIHNLTGITIEWEGYDATCHPRVRAKSQIPQSAVRG